MQRLKDYVRSAAPKLKDYISNFGPLKDAVNVYNSKAYGTYRHLYTGTFTTIFVAMFLPELLPQTLHSDIMLICNEKGDIMQMFVDLNGVRKELFNRAKPQYSAAVKHLDGNEKIREVLTAATSKVGGGSGGGDGSIAVYIIIALALIAICALFVLKIESCKGDMNACQSFSLPSQGPRRIDPKVNYYSQ